MSGAEPRRILQLLMASARNVDRQMAIYQAIFPETYVESCGAATMTYTIDRDEIIDANSSK